MSDSARRAAEGVADEAERRFGEATAAARERIERVLGHARATGRHTVETVEETVEAHLFAQAHPATAINPTLPPMVDVVLSRAMTKERGQRTPTVARFVAELRKALAPRKPVSK